jgi:hypothetical protein
VAARSEATCSGSDGGGAEEGRQLRLDGAGLLSRSFALDVFACSQCGGRRRVLAYLKAPCGVRAILEHLGLPWPPGRLAPARGPPQNLGC